MTCSSLFSDPYKTQVNRGESSENPELGSSFTLTCVKHSTGNPPTVQNIKWTHNGTAISVRQSEAFMVPDTHDLNVTSVGFDDSGIYRCYVDNSADGLVLETVNDEAEPFTLNVYCT